MPMKASTFPRARCADRRPSPRMMSRPCAWHSTSSANPASTTTRLPNFTQAITSARRDILAEWPIVAQFKAPDTDPGALLPVHAGAAEYYNGSQLSFLDKWGNVIFLAPMALGALASIAAALWQFLKSGEYKPREPALDALYALAQQIRHAEKDTDLADDREPDRRGAARPTGAEPARMTTRWMRPRSTSQRTASKISSTTARSRWARPATEESRLSSARPRRSFR